jgi:4-amino-4-deoxy-L-arabinose transferase-like glycosyltransferase
MAGGAPRDEAAYVLSTAKAWLYVALVAAWLLTGITGHDPWKPDEAENFGVIHSIIQGGSWVVPMLAGEPLLEAPPLYHVSAALFARLAGGWLPAHDAARLATPFYLILTLVFLKLAGRRLLGGTEGWIAIIAFIGCVGLLVRAHLMVPEIALLAGLAMALYGFSLAQKHSLAGGLLLGSGAGIGFLATGALAPFAAAAAAALLPAAFPEWRSRGYATALAVALLAAAPWLAAWPAALHQHSPALFQRWLDGEVLAMLPGLSPVNPLAQLGFLAKTLVWAAWPVLPMAAWTLWHGRGQALAKPAVQISVALLGGLLPFLAFMPGAGEGEVLPLLPPLTLLAVAGLHTLRRGAAAFLDWFGIMTFGLFAALLWLGWLNLLTGEPAFLAARSRYLRAGVPLDFAPWALVLGTVVTLGWILFVWRVGLGNRRAVINWAAGITLVWVLAMTLMLPWVNGFKSYRPVATALKKQLPARHGCIASRGLAEAPRAMFHYFGGIVTQRLELRPGAQCDLLLVQSARELPPNSQWKKVWEGARPLEKGEQFRLYRRAASGAKG